MCKGTPNILLFLISLFLSSCYEDKSGCLDVTASNFSIEADEDCCEQAPGVDDVCCCTYPDMIININHLHGDVNVSLNTPYENALGQLYLISSLEFYISGIRVHGQDWYTINNRLELRDDLGPIDEMIDDVTQISPSSFQYRIGDFTIQGAFDDFSMEIGLPTGIEDVDFSQLSTNHALDTSSNVLYNAEQDSFLMYRVVMITDTIQMKTRTFQMSAQNSLALSLSLSASKERGEELSIPIAIDYRTWFDQVDLLGEDSLEIGKDIAASIPASISIVD